MKGNLLNYILNQISCTDLEKDTQKKKQIWQMLKKIEDEKIIAGIGMAEMPKIVYLLTLKYQKEPEIIPIENDLMIRVDECNVANFSYLAIYIHFLKIEENILHIEGNISMPIAFERDNQLNIKCNDVIFESILCEAGFDCKLGTNIYEKRTVFKVNIPLIQEKNEILFSNIIKGYEWNYGKINSMRFAPISDCIPGQYSIFDNWMVSISGNSVICRYIESARELEIAEERYQDIIRTQYGDNGVWAAGLRKKYQNFIRKKRKKIWLFMDRADRADDNAEVFFKYMQKHKDVDTYFLIDSNAKDFERLATSGNVVPLYSEEHYLLVLQADYIISSQCNGVVENPFWDKAEFFRDLYHKPRIIFLQHGVIKDDMSPTLNRFNTNFWAFITSTKEEYQSILEYPYYYSPKEIWLTGLPLFDELINKEEKIILVMPTWRQELMHQEWSVEKNNMVWVPNEGWKKSIYFKHYYSLFHNKKLWNVCKKKGYRMAFMPHPLLEPYAEELVSGGFVELWDSKKSYRKAFAEGSILITDYSSVAFEFGYLRKPILYYQFDKDKFFENHTYRKGYFNYEGNGLGEVVYSKSLLIKKVIEYLRTNCKVLEIYEHRINELYKNVNQDACERIYRMMIGGL